MIELRSPGWSSGPVFQPVGFWQRWRGVKALPPDVGLLIRTRSVHTFGLHHPLGVVALSPERCILAADHIRPRQVVSVPGAYEYLELPEGRRLPPVGVVLEARPIVTG